MARENGKDLAGLYLHIPFCSAICPYCDFAVVTGDEERRSSFLRGLASEIELHRDDPLTFDTVYFGGGTPSLITARQLEELIGALRETLRVGEDVRMFLEANPEDVNVASVACWRELGIRTLSLGVQSLRDDELRALGRRHDRQQALRSVELALEVGFDTVSIDLIYGLPGQRLEHWTQVLENARRLEPDHISCYQLTVHEGTPFGRRRQQGRLSELPESTQADFFERTHQFLEDAGYEAYEVSNFARSPAHRSQHNQKYWNHTTYLGLGPSAHSYRGSERWWNEKDLSKYSARVASAEFPVAGRETLDPHELALEAVMLRLRTTAGIDLDEFHSRYGVDLVSRNGKKIGEYVENGLLHLDENRLLPTRRGLAVADSITAALEVGGV